MRSVRSVVSGVIYFINIDVDKENSRHFVMILMLSDSMISLQASKRSFIFWSEKHHWTNICLIFIHSIIEGL